MVCFFWLRKSAAWRRGSRVDFDWADREYNTLIGRLRLGQQVGCVVVKLRLPDQIKLTAKGLIGVRLPSILRALPAVNSGLFFLLNGHSGRFGGLGFERCRTNKDVP